LEPFIKEKDILKRLIVEKENPNRNKSAVIKEANSPQPLKNETTAYSDPLFGSFRAQRFFPAFCECTRIDAKLILCFEFSVYEIGLRKSTKRK